MDIDLARDMIRTAFRSSSELQELLGTLKEKCSSEEFKDYARGIAGAMDAIGVALTNKALSAYPELHAEVDASIEKYGRYR